MWKRQAGSVRADDDAVGDAGEAGDIARDLLRAPALALSLGLPCEDHDAPLDLHVEVFDAEPLVPSQLVQHVAL